MCVNTLLVIVFHGALLPLQRVRHSVRWLFALSAWRWHIEVHGWNLLNASIMMGSGLLHVGQIYATHTKVWEGNILRLDT